jgi:hypothetical protein
MGRPKT